MQEEAGTSLIPSSSHRTGPASAPAAGRSRLYALVAGIAVLTLVADQGTKAWALATVTPGEARPLIGDWIRLNLIRNSGAAFSLGNTMTWVLTALSIVIVIGVLVVVRRVATPSWAVTFGLLLGGAVGNLGDRIFRTPGWFRGHVVDFLDYFGLFIGNVADIAIVVAAGAVILLTFRGTPATTGSTHE